jgi:MinD superfamily P-loop ATPase
MTQIDTKAIINRIKNLQNFEVQIALPEDFHFFGKVPFDMDIVGDQAFVKVLAENMEEATTKVREYFYG